MWEGFNVITRVKKSGNPNHGSDGRFASSPGASEKDAKAAENAGSGDEHQAAADYHMAMMKKLGQSDPAYNAHAQAHYANARAADVDEDERDFDRMSEKANDASYEANSEAAPGRKRGETE